MDAKPIHGHSATASAFTRFPRRTRCSRVFTYSSAAVQVQIEELTRQWLDTKVRQ